MVDRPYSTRVFTKILSEEKVPWEFVVEIGIFTAICVILLVSACSAAVQ